MWLMADATRVGWPTAMGRITLSMKTGLNSAGWNFNKPSKIQITPSRDLQCAAVHM